MQNIQNQSINHNNTKHRFINFLSKRKNIIIPILVVLSYVLFYFIIDPSSQSLVAHDEGLYARRSRLVEESNNWLSFQFTTPHHKTIGSYWLIALSIRLFGNSELALRLLSIISSFFCLVTTYLIALEISNKNTAIISILSLSSMPLWIQYSRYASPDISFVLCILLVILFFLKSIHNSQNINNYIYIFSSGLFLSSAFFLRSYMMLVPLFGLTPFILVNLYNKKNTFKLFFICGIIVGFIPSFFNLYFSYQKYGMTGISSLFDFARNQAVGTFDYKNLFLIPLNYIYLTFPIGFLFIILLVFTKTKTKPSDFPLLIYCYPILSLSLLLCMSTSYPHYYLFLLPSLSLLFALKSQYFSFKFRFSKNIFQFLVTLFILFICFTILILVFFYNDYLLQFNYQQNLLVYIIALLLFLSFIASLRFLFVYNLNGSFLRKFLHYLIIPQYISLSLLYNFGVLGNPNLITKSFLDDKSISSIVNNNTIYLFKVDSKIETLLSYYLPNSRVVKSTEHLKRFDYIITSDSNLVYDYENKFLFRSIRNFDNHFLLMNISK